jgi:hypothetical protein
LFLAVLGICPLLAHGDEVIIGTGTSSWYFPLFTYFHDARTQTIYLASELGGSCRITGLALYVTQLPGQTMNNFTIRMKHTDMSAYGDSPNWESSDWTTVYQANQNITATGWVQFDFTNNFEYNGSQNLIVDISFNNNSWTYEGYCWYSVPGGTRTIYYYTDSGYGDPLAWSGGTPAPYSSDYVPNIKLTVESSSMVTVPVFTPGGGVYNSAQNVVITCATPGATIHYTTTGLDPTESDPTIASGASVPVNNTLTLKAKAWKDGLEPSNVKSATYQLMTDTPVFSPGGGTYNYEPNIVITCATPGATIRYTTTGLDPNESDPNIASGASVHVDHALTLKAKAWKDGLDPSNLMTADYNIVLSDNSALPWLHTEGNKIKDPNGNVVVLRGVVIPEILNLQYSEGGIIPMIDRVTDMNDTQGSYKGWYTKVVRVPCYPYPPMYYDDYVYPALRAVVDYCKSKNLYVIIDCHDVADTWEDTTVVNEFWDYMAPRFANDSHVLFEIFNEPINNIQGDDNAKWLSVMADMQPWVDTARSHAPNNLILVAGPSWSQIIGPAVEYPVSGGNVVYVSHIYPIHWLSGQSWYIEQIMTCASVYPVMMTEWGFSNDPNMDGMLWGTITDYGQPLMDFREMHGIGSTAWVASSMWEPPMFYPDWTLRCGEGEMGCFVKDMLYLKRNDDPAGKPPQLPYGGTARAIPGTIEAEDYDTGGEGIAYNDTTAGNSGGAYRSDDVDIETCSEGGYDVNGIEAGEWLEYTVNVKTRGFYDIEMRVASASSGGSFHIEFDKMDVTGPVSFEATGDAQTYTTVEVNDVALNPGQHIMRLSMDSAGWNANWIKFTKVGFSGRGGVFREWWNGIQGTSVNNLKADVNYPNNPSGIDLLGSMEGPVDVANDYGTRIRGYLYSPADGEYTFWIASAADSQLWLSIDADPVNRNRIASLSGYTYPRQWNKYSNQESGPVWLDAGEKYYIEVLHKAGVGDDNISVAWQGPDDLSPQVINGAYLSPFILMRGFTDFADFAAQWGRTDCGSPDWCSGVDSNQDGTVSLNDLSAFARTWLVGAE